MNSRIRRFLRRPAFAVLLVLAGVVGLQGCNRGHGWWGGSAHSAERMEKRMEWAETDVAEKLAIRPEQEQAYRALAERYKTLARAYRGNMMDRVPDLKGAFGEQPLNSERIGEVVKEIIRGRPSNEELEALVNQTVEFVSSLDAEQQEHIRERISDKLERH